MNKSFNTLKIGLLGGGQLGRMLLQKAADFSLIINVLDPDASAPCRHLANEFVTGSFADYETVYSFGKNCDLLTIEIEHVNTEALAALESEGVTVYPHPHIISLVQDKGEQKLFYRKNNIPTAPFHLISDKEELLQSQTKFPFIQKLRKGGYDGRGVIKISSAEDFDKAFNEPSIAEEMIDFEKEIAVIVARSKNGECKCFPAVDMEFNRDANLVEYLFSPADLRKEIEDKAMNIAVKVAEALQITGILAVEMFLTRTGEILVNEIAPRPHNSGHHTIEANVTSQYEQHLRAILGMPLGNTETLFPAVMVNLLGEKNHDGIVNYRNMEEVMSMDGVHVHLYGKKFTRPFRKMGHVTVTAKTLEDAKTIAKKVKDLLKVESI